MICKTLERQNILQNRRISIYLGGIYSDCCYVLVCTSFSPQKKDSLFLLWSKWRPFTKLQNSCGIHLRSDALFFFGSYATQWKTMWIISEKILSRFKGLNPLSKRNVQMFLKKILCTKYHYSKFKKQCCQLFW